jgi:hypothetical protein
MPSYTVQGADDNNQAAKYVVGWNTYATQSTLAGGKDGYTVMADHGRANSVQGQASSGHAAFVANGPAFASASNNGRNMQVQYG